MDPEQFRQLGYKVVDMIADYYANLNKLASVNHTVQPGYLAKLLPDEAPREGEPIDDILQDFQSHILPGVTHWQSPNFFSYFPCNSSFPSMLGDMLSNMVNAQGFSWSTCPSMTELESVTLLWLGKAIGLGGCPDLLRGGSIQGSASEAVLVSMIGARDRALKVTKCDSDALLSYCSDQTHSSVIKAAKILNLKVKALPTNKLGQLTGEVLLEAIKADLEAGMVPFHVTGTMGTTAVGATDQLLEIGQVIQPYRDHIWYHVDSAYAGSALILPEYQNKYIEGIYLANSICFNPHKWLRVNFDCSVLYTKEVSWIRSSLSSTANYYTPTSGITDYKDLQIPLGRRFRSLKLWFVLRSFGIDKLQTDLQNHITMATSLSHSLVASGCYILAVPVSYSLITFHVKPTTTFNNPEEEMLEINLRTKYCHELIVQSHPTVSLTTGEFNGLKIIRIAIGNYNTEQHHIDNLLRIMIQVGTQAQQEDITTIKRVLTQS